MCVLFFDSPRPSKREKEEIAKEKNPTGFFFLRLNTFLLGLQMRPSFRVSQYVL